MRLGDFEIEAEIGQGAAGVVWRGRHVRQGAPVAIKRLRDSGAQRVRVQDEIHAVAAMIHPNIVTLLDHGETPDGPYLVMELADAGSLQEHLPDFDWPRLRDLLDQLLAGLAHAHARGVVHCDLKPENVLMFATGQGLRPKLTDFGIAHAYREGTVDDDRVQGTPHYMAPEQFAAQRERGPWTDLYALGCVAFEVLTGHRPFEGSTPLALAVAHLEAPRPPLRPRFPVPDGLEAWLHRMMAVDWRARFRSAAHAAWALSNLTGAMAPALASVPSEAEAAPTLLDLTPFPHARSVTPAPAPTDSFPPLPATWRAPPVPPAPLAGLGLYGVRSVPLIGRDAERDRIWGALAHVVSGKGLRVVLVEGPTGSGKSRLVEWVAERAHEVGAGLLLSARHQPNPGPADGLRGLLARWVGAEPDVAKTAHRVHRVRRQPGPPTWFDHALAAYAVGAPEPAFRSAAERLQAVLNLLADAGAGQPVILVLDDLHWGPESTELIQAMLRVGGPPALILGTARDDIEPTTAHGGLLAIAADPATTTVPIDPIDRVEHGQLVRALLPLEDSLVDEVVSRTEGNPLFAVQLVGDWVARGVLHGGSGGFERDTDVPAVVPDDIHALWQGRLAHVLADTPLATALEIAAVLGVSVDEQEWMTASARAGCQVRRGDLDPLVRAGLLRRDDAGFSFVHGMLRESVLRNAADRLPRLNRACADALAPLATRRPELAERVAEFWLATDAQAQAADLLATAARTAVDYGQRARGEALLARFEGVLVHLDAAADDPRWGLAHLLRGTLALSRGQVDRARVLLRRGATVAERADLGLLGEVRRFQGIIERAEGHAEAALERFAEAERLADSLGDRVNAGKALLGTIGPHLGRSDVETAGACIASALDHFRAAGDTWWESVALAELGLLAFNRGQDERARALGTQNLRVAEACGDTANQGRAHNTLGMLAWVEGELDVAEDHFLAAQALYNRIDNINAIVAAGHLALVAFARGRLGETGVHARACLNGLADTPWAASQPAVIATLAAYASSTGDAAQLEGALVQLEAAPAVYKGSRLTAAATERVARWMVDRDRRAALRLARVAMEHYALGQDAANQARVEAWIETLVPTVVGA